MAGRASIVGAAATHVGKVREHNEDAHHLDLDRGMFLVCDGMGGHAAGEVASALAIRSIQQEWARDGVRKVADHWLERGTPDAKKQLLEVVRAGVVAAHHAILAEAERDEAKSGMGTTLVGAMVVGGELVFAHAGDSRAYLVRDGISMQLTEDHTLLARLLAAGIDVDVSGEGSRFRSMLTNALGIGEEVKVSTFVVPLADGDRFLLCSDGISEYVPENEVGDVLTSQPSPARAAERLIELALARGGGDNATAVVVRVLEAGETPLPAEQRKRDDAAIGSCALWGTRVTPQQRLRALRIAIPRDHNSGDKLPPHALGDRVAWIIVEGAVVQGGVSLGPGALVYPESLVHTPDTQPPARDALAITRGEVRALAIRADDFRELCDDDGELGEALLESLAQVIAKRRPRGVVRTADPPVDPSAHTDPHLPAVASPDGADPQDPTDPNLPVAGGSIERERVATVPDDEPTLLRAEVPARPGSQVESPIIAPAPPRATPSRAPPRPSPPPPPTSKRVSPPPPAAPSRPSPPPARPVSQPPDRPSPPPARAPSRPSPPPPPPRSKQPSAPPPVRPTPTQAHAAAVLPYTPAPVHGIPRLPTAATRTPAPTPAGGIPPLARAESAARPGSLQGAAGSVPTPKPGAPADREVPARPRPEAAHGSHVVARSVRKAAAPALTVPADPDPEIETYLELEAELPPEPGSEIDLSSDLALGLDGNADDEHESVSITIEQDSTRVTQTVTETEALTLTLTVTEPSGNHAPVRTRAITAENGAAVSGTIHDSSGPSRPARRPREGYDD